MKQTAKILFIASLVLLICHNADAAAFKAGVSRADITPPAGQPMWGYTNRTSGATGVLDRLYARILVLDDGQKSVAFVTLDLGRTFGKDQMDYVRQQAQKISKIDDVIFVASHTHSGPVIEETYPDRKIPEWEQTALDGIIRSIGEARSEAGEVRIGTGWGGVHLGHNRRVVKSDGTVGMLWRNSTGLPTSGGDPTVGVIRIDNMNGYPTAILVNYACHPVVLGSDNPMFSADYPGAMVRAVEKTWQNSVCMFVQGACGDINPFFDKTPLIENAVQEMRRTGEKLAAEVLRVSRQITTQVPSKPKLGLIVEEMTFKNRWDLDKLKVSLQSRFGPEFITRYGRYLVDKIIAPVTTFVINDEIAIIGMPGEPFLSFQIDLRIRSPLRDTFFCGYTNGYAGYFPTIKDAAVGGYGADTITTQIEVGAGERMLDRAIVNLYHLLGRLSDKPEKPE